MAGLIRLVVVLSALALVVPAGAPAAMADAHEPVVSIAFPTVSTARFGDDYDGARGSRAHRATDLFAPAGAPVYAARAGRVVWAPQAEQPGAGFALQILGEGDRTYAYYHLGPAGGRRAQGVVGGIKLGSQVARGQRVGVVGDSGNAAGGSAHLHFEIHDGRRTDPYGGDRLNPYPSLLAAQGRRPPRASGSAPTADALRLGDSGPAVAAWQRELNQTRSGNPIETDGIFGPRTWRATAILQRQVGLGPVGLGVVGAETRVALTRAVRDRRAGSLPATTSRTLRLGDRGPAVTAWQRELNRVRGAGLVPDGVFGPRTQHATVRFQRSADLGPTGLGIVGPKTRAAMVRQRR